MKNIAGFVLLMVCFLLQTVTSNAQKAKAMHGTVYDQVRRVPVESCSVRILDKEGKLILGTVSDRLGQFSFALPIPVASTKIEVSHVIYQTKTADINIHKPSDYELLLLPRVYTIEDVIVCSSYSSENRGNQFAYTPMEAASSISIIGEPDVVRHISSMPGVSQGMEGTLGLFVRGGNTGGNRIEFNQVPIHSFSHLLGLFSAFAPDIIEKTVFKPGGLPAGSGNLSSSLLQITPKLSTGRSLNAKFTLSPYMTGGYLSLPIRKDTLSVQLSARTSFLPYIISKLEDGEGEIKAHVLDVTAIVDWRLNQRQRMDAMVYISSDYFDFKDSEVQSKQEWGSKAFKLGWHMQTNPRWYSSVWAYYNHTYASQQQINFDTYANDEEKTSDLRLGTTLNEFALNAKTNYQLSTNFNLSGGMEYAR